MARSAAQSEREVIGEQPVLEECVVTELSSAQKGVAVENKAISIADIAETEESAADSYRTSEVGTAFFYPTLMSDSLGNVSVSFTVPNENATWQFYALAYTSDLFTGRYEAQTISSKPLMVSPNLPRFVRQGDEVTVSTAKISSCSPRNWSNCTKMKYATRQAKSLLRSPRPGRFTGS